MKKRLPLMLILLLLLMQGTAISATAISMPDLTQKGSLTIEMHWNGETLQGGQLRICKIADIHAETARFERIAPLRGEALSLEDPTDPAVAAKALALALEKQLPMLSAPITEGTARFENLETGLYLVYQTTQDASDGFAPIKPYLISVPYLSDGKYFLDVTAKPKVPLEEAPPVPTEPEPTKPTDSHLPQTGQLNWPVPILVVGGLVLFLLGWFLYFGGNKKKHETENR